MAFSSSAPIASSRLPPSPTGAHHFGTRLGHGSKEGARSCSARAVWGFIGLEIYCRKFVKEFGAMAAPLTSLLKRQLLLVRCGQHRLCCPQDSHHDGFGPGAFQLPPTLCLGMRCLNIWLRCCLALGPVPMAFSRWPAVPRN